MVIYDMKGKLFKCLKLFENGYIFDISSQYDDLNVFISYGNILELFQVYYFDFEVEWMMVFYIFVIILKFGNFEICLVWLESYDGILISMYVIYIRELKLNGQYFIFIFVGGCQEGLFVFMYNMQEWLIVQFMLRQGGICVIFVFRGGSVLNIKFCWVGQWEYK